MIVIYLNPNQPKDTYDKKLKEIIDTTEVYHFGELTVITERNPTIIMDILRYYKPYQFITYSLNEFDSSPTMISELIISMVDKLDITFNTIEDNLYFDKDNFLEIYPKVFENYKRES